jgi:hypothetical protein
VYKYRRDGVGAEGIDRIGLELRMVTSHDKRGLWKLPSMNKGKDEKILCNRGCLLTGPAHTQQIYRDGHDEEIGT